MGMYSLDEQCYEYFKTKEEFDNFMKDRPLVVRCKDCEYAEDQTLYKQHPEWKICMCPSSTMDYYEARVLKEDDLENGFCYWGKRKDKT